MAYQYSNAFVRDKLRAMMDEGDGEEESDQQLRNMKSGTGTGGIISPSMRNNSSPNLGRGICDLSAGGSERGTTSTPKPSFLLEEEGISYVVTAAAAAAPGPPGGPEQPLPAPPPPPPLAPRTTSTESAAADHHVSFVVGGGPAAESAEESAERSNSTGSTAEGTTLQEQHHDHASHSKSHKSRKSHKSHRSSSKSSSKRSSTTSSHEPRDPNRPLTDNDRIVIHTSIHKLQQAEKEMLEIQHLNEVPESLRLYSLMAGIFQLSSGITMAFLILLQTKDSEGTTKRPWYTNYPGRNGVSPQPHLIADFSILWYSPFFLLLSAVEHLACVAFREHYTYYIARNQNPFRWMEYSLSASTMRVMIAQLVGVSDVHLLASTFVLTALMIQTGATHEDFNAKARADGHRQNWRSFWVSWVAFAASWVFIFTYVSNAVARGALETYMWGLIVTLFILDTTFGVLFTMQWKRIPPFNDYVRGEKGFILLSFTAKTCLAWICFGYLAASTRQQLPEGGET